MGVVWLARLQARHGFEKLVAIKTILPELARQPRFRNMFLDEARIASRLVHANVVQVLDLGEQGDTLYQVMEWVDGDSLRAVMLEAEMRGERVAVDVAVRIVLDACAGLHAAHELRDEAGVSLEVVHRDVSPHNVLVDFAGVAKVTDFGIARAQGRLSPDTSLGTVRGKLRYMAPEQAMGTTVDRRADVWALGAVLYELLSGRAPFEADNDAALLRHLMTSTPSLVFDPTTPRALEPVVRRALARDPRARYSTAAEMAEALQQAAAKGSFAGSSERVREAVSSLMKDSIEQRSSAVELARKAARARRESHLEQPVAPARPVGDLSLDVGPELVPRPVDDPVTAGASERRSPTPDSAPAIVVHVTPRIAAWTVVGTTVVVMGAVVLWFLATAGPSETAGFTNAQPAASGYDLPVPPSVLSRAPDDASSGGGAEPPSAAPPASTPVTPTSWSFPQSTRGAPDRTTGPAAPPVSSDRAGAGGLRKLYEGIDDGF